MTFRTGASFCNPAPQPGRFCGGPFVRVQVNPFGPGSGKGPYHFQVREGFLPSGLVLHTNGLLTGTVLKYTAVRRWPFSVCVSATTIVPNVGQAGSTCRRTSIVVAANFAGTWHGTYSGTIDDQICPAVHIDGRITFTISENGGDRLGAGIFGNITLTNSAVTETSSPDGTQRCLPSYSDDHLGFGAFVQGMTATGVTTVKTLTMAAGQNSFSGSLSDGLNWQSGLVTFTVTRG
jgi:hypothetical protein